MSKLLRVNYLLLCYGLPLDKFLFTLKRIREYLYCFIELYYKSIINSLIVSITSIIGYQGIGYLRYLNHGQSPWVLP